MVSIARRKLLAALAGAAAWPLATRAQQDRWVRWIGVLMIFPDTGKNGSGNATAFEEGLAALGWNVGRNIAIDYRWAVTDVEKGRSAVAQVLRLSPDLILANGGPALTAAQQATRTLPIVFTGSASQLSAALSQVLPAPAAIRPVSPIWNQR
jgi:putative ABC transport system substrate-binding protein